MVNFFAEFALAVYAFFWGVIFGYVKGREDRGP